MPAPPVASTCSDSINPLSEGAALDYLLVCTIALLASALTFFSGFGLGTLLLPAFALFFPIEVAIAATAVVHLANNVFKLALVGKDADWRVVVQFGIPSALGAVLGAIVLQSLTDVPPLAEYQWAGQSFSITTVKLVVAALMVVFAVLELSPRFEAMAFPRKYFLLGGAISGFFGGLSGHQGALRTAFLIRSGLTKEAFIGTRVVAAVVVDVSRLLVYSVAFFYSQKFALLEHQRGIPLVVAGAVAAFIGSFIGARLIRKVTMGSIRLIVGIGLLVLAVAIGAGLV